MKNRFPDSLKFRSYTDIFIENDSVRFKPQNTIGHKYRATVVVLIN